MRPGPKNEAGRSRSFSSQKCFPKRVREFVLRAGIIFALACSDRGAVMRSGNRDEALWHKAARHHGAILRLA